MTHDAQRSSPGVSSPARAASGGLLDGALQEALDREVDEAFEPHQLTMLERFVVQPSHTWAKADVAAMQDLIDAEAQALGLQIERIADPSGRFADHRVYQGPGTRDDDTAWLLVGHTDTVFPRELGFLSFHRQGDAVFGPGVLDMKSGLTSVLCALRALARVSPAHFGRLKVRFACVSDEEVGSPSSAALFARLAAQTCGALVFEAGREHDRIVVSRKGSASFRLVVEGRAAHAGNRHQEGVNAIHALALLIPEVEALTDYERGVTVNVGLVEGGTAKNTVAERASCSIDARFVYRNDGARLVDQLSALAAQPFARVASMPDRLRSARVTLEGGLSRPPMEAAARHDALRLAYEPFAARVGLGVGEAPLQGGGSDANLLASHGVACIDGLGPYGKHFHERAEWSSLTSLRQRTKALAAFLAAQADEPRPG